MGAASVAGTHARHRAGLASVHWLRLVEARLAPGLGLPIDVHQGKVQHIAATARLQRGGVGKPACVATLATEPLSALKVPRLVLLALAL